MNWSLRTGIQIKVSEHISYFRTVKVNTVSKAELFLKTGYVLKVETTANDSKVLYLIPLKTFYVLADQVTFFTCSLDHLLLHDLTMRDRGFLTLRRRSNPGRRVRWFLWRFCTLIQPWIPGSGSLPSADISMTHTAQMNSVKQSFRGSVSDVGVPHEVWVNATKRCIRPTREHQSSLINVL